MRAERARGIVARWRRAGYTATGRLGPGPAWCWLTRSGLAVTGQHYTAARPALGRLAHIRAVLAIRLSLQDSEAFRDGRAWRRSERRIRIRARNAELHDQHTRAQIQLAALDDAPPANDPSLLDELPYLPGILAQAPDNLKEKLLAAALLADPRTDSDQIVPQPSTPAPAGELEQSPISS